MSQAKSNKSVQINLGKPAFIAAAIGLLSFFLYLPSLGNGFIDNYDDSQYVTNNLDVLDGLSINSVVAAFTKTYAANWHPLTMLSHMTDVSLFGRTATGHHFTNIILHSLNAILFFIFLRRATGSTLPSGIAALLFAAHPIHVQNVAAVFQRKDLLSTFFLLLTLLAYLRYAHQKSAKRMALVVGYSILGLLAKPMLVTLPFMLLLLDVWPLKRSEPWRKLVIEKLPLFIVIGIFCATTLIAQSFGGAIADTNLRPLPMRIENALVSYVEYLRILVWPTGLAIHYPYPKEIGVVRVAGAIGVLVMISAITIWLRKSRPAALVGWLWFLGAMVPVIGIVQVGAQAMADRYAYVPFLGLYMAIAFVLHPQLTSKSGVVAVFGFALGILGVLTFREQQYWRDDTTLWERALVVTSENEFAHSQLATIYWENGIPERSLEHAREAARIAPTPFMLGDLANFLLMSDNVSEAEQTYRKILTTHPQDPNAIARLGRLLVQQNRMDEVQALVSTIDPPSVDSEIAVARIYFAAKKYAEAEQHFRKAIALDASSEGGHFGLAVTLEQLNRHEEAAESYRRVAELNPENFTARMRADAKK